MFTIPKKIYNRIFYTYQRYKREFKSIEKIEPSNRDEFYYYYLLRFYLKLPFHFPFKTDANNSIFQLKDLLTFASNLRKLSLFDDRLRQLIDDIYIKGVRAWEYGKLLSLMKFDFSPTILDIGPGSSTFSYYLASKGAKVTTIDLSKPMEKRWYVEERKQDVNEVLGTVLRLPFSDNSYDVVIAISTLEHLDTDYKKNKQLPYSKFTRDTKIAIKEMVRVTKHGGKIFVTSDAYLPGQKTDRWITDITYRGIGGAYKLSDIEKVYLKTLKKLNCFPLHETSYPDSLLIENTTHSNYRGRYFMTFSLWYEKH